MKNSFIALLGRGIASFFGLIISIMLARLLGSSKLGQYQLAISTQTTILTILALGFGNASIYFINSMGISKVKITSLIFKLYSIISILFGLIIYGFFKLNPNYFGSYNDITLFFLSISSGALLLYTVLVPILYSSMDILRIQITILSSSLIFILLTLIIFLYFDLSIDLVICSYSVGVVASFLLLFNFLKPYINFHLRMDFLLLKNMFSYGFKIAAANLVFILSSNIVVFLMKYLLHDGFDAVGLYSRAVSVANIVLLFPATLGTLLYSKWSGMNSGKIQIEVERTLRIFVTFTFCFSFIIFLFGEEILVFLYGQEFLYAKTCLFILSISVIFSSVGIVLNNFFSSIGKPLITLQSYSVSLVVTTILAFIMIPRLNISGAAYSVLGGLFINILMMYLSVKNFISLDLKKCFIITFNDVEYLFKMLIK